MRESRDHLRRESPVTNVFCLSVTLVIFRYIKIEANNKKIEICVKKIKKKKKYKNSKSRHCHSSILFPMKFTTHALPSGV